MMVESPDLLTGRTILVTRARSQASELVAKIEELGGSVIEFPLIQMVPASDQKPLEDAIKHLDEFNWILFTSINGVDFFARKMQQMGYSFSAIRANIGAVGPKTAEAIDKWGKTTNIIAEDYQAEGMLEVLKDQLVPGEHVLLPRVNIAKSDLPAGIRSWGVQVTEVVAYENVLSSEGRDKVLMTLREGQLDMITFTSSSTVRNFCEVMKDQDIVQLLSGVKVACIGPVTARTAEELGIHVDRVAEEYTIEGLIQAIQSCYE